MDDIKANIKIDGITGCWIWQGCLENNRPLVKVKQKTTYVYRLVWELINGEIPKGMNVCHHCDNPPCVNPAHLFVGTQRDNLQDAVKKGRTKTCGNINPNCNLSILTIPQVLQIKDYLDGGNSIKDIAEEFNVSPDTIAHIKHGRRWGRITGISHQPIPHK
jgi:hypothetical protein